MLARSLNHLGQRSSRIALVGASALLLATMGELMHHASAMASEGRSAEPRLEMAATVAGRTASALAIESSVEMLTAPVFKPFVYVELPLPSGCTLLPDPGVHVNVDGVVVATMNNGSNNYGYIWYDEDREWQGPIEDGSGDIILDNAGLRGINDELEICGTRSNSGPKAFFLALSSDYAGTLTQIGSGYAKDINNEGVVVGTGTGGSPVGWWDIIGSPVALPSLPSGDATNAVGVTPDTTLGNSLIVGQSKDASSKYQAVVWYNDGAWQVEDLTGITGSDVGFAIDVNGDGVIIGGLLTSGSISDTIHWYYDDVGDEWTGVSLGASALFIPEAINNQANPEIVGDKYLWVSTSVASGTGSQLDLSSMSLGLPSNMINMRCTDINDAGEVVGVGQLGSGGAWVAFKLVPYDVNNNGESDVREIVQGIEDDLDENWLIDWAETDTANTPSGMRLGLHGPGNIATDGKIDPVQIVRLKVNIAPHGGLHPDGPEQQEDFFVDEIVGISSTPECEACQDFTDLIVDWGTGAGRPGTLEGEQCEILVRVHSMMGNDAAFGNNEGLPENQTAHDQALEDLESFGYRFAHCVDYVQWGNESFSTSSGYMFRDDDLSGTGCTWTGDPKKFNELTDTSVGSACKEEAVGLVLDWQEEMMWAALRGSALAGRPLRMVTTGIINKNVRNGYDAGNAQDPTAEPGYIGYYLTNAVTSWANENQMYFSMHTHYFTVAEAIEAIQKLVDTYQGAGAPWDVPNWRISTEVGTKADFDADNWWTSGNPPFIDRHNEFMDPNGEPPADYYWENLIDDWEDGSEHFGATGFGIDDVLAEFADAGFAAVCWSCLQFGSHNPPNNPSPFFVEALRADKLGDSSFTQRSDAFTPIKDAYVTHGASYYISDSVFTPHSCACTSANTCPGCP